jgi:PR domain zinc finger protein 5
MIGNSQYGNIYGGEMQPNQLLHQQQQQQQHQQIDSLPYGARETIIASSQHPTINYQPQHMMHVDQSGHTIPATETIHVAQSLPLHQPVPADSVIQHSDPAVLLPSIQQIETPVSTETNEKVGETETPTPVISPDPIVDSKPADKEEDSKTDVITAPESATAADVKKEEIDPQQCRVCMSNENLVDIFQFENVFRLVDLIMKICPTVKITERDYLPHLICNGCVTKVKIAYELKTTCENSEKEYRSKLKRSRNKTRTRTDYVLVNAPDFTESEEDEEIQDEEFKISGSEEEETDEDSDESFEIDNRKKRSGRKSSSSKRKYQKSKKSSSSGHKSSSKKFKTDVVYIEANDDSSEEDDSDDVTVKKSVNNNSAKKKPTQVTPKVSIVKKIADTKSVPACHICNKTFVKRSSLKAHIERHNEPATIDCNVCHRVFSSKGRMERHSCQAKTKVKRPTSSAPSRSSDVQTGVGRDLFKTVAPVTSTYWSDEFSD